MKRIFCTVLVALTFCASASAQHNLRTGYFLDGYAYSHKLNPAFASDRGYFAIPVAGYLTAGLETNLSLSTLLYPTGNGTLTTFLSPSVSAEDFMSRIHTNNPINLNADISLFSLGFHAGKSFNSLDISLKADARANVPGALFSWAKQYDEHFDMSALGLRADARLEIAYGYSRSIMKNIRVGAKVKFIAGLAKAEYSMDKLVLDLDENKWRAEAEGNGYFCAPGVSLTTNNGVINGIDIPDVEELIKAAEASRNFGAAIDLGFSMDIIKILTVSASITDLGFINWNGSRLGSTNRSLEYTGLKDLGADDTNIDEQLSALGDELLEIISPKVMGQEKITDMLSMTAHVGLECRMPFYKRLSAGLLGTYRFDGPHSWWETRASVNLALLRFFSLTANYAYSTFGDSYGAAINFHPNGINLFIGVDSFKPALNMTKQYIPIDSFNTNLSFGLNIAFGRAHGRYAKKLVEDFKL